MTRLLLLIALAFATSAPLAAAPAMSASARRWDATGHRAMAAIAYDRLRPATRARVNAILREHPDIATLGDGLDLRSASGLRELFLRASVWPDRIRGDARFYQETNPNARATPLLPGFPTMARRDGWHYLTRSFSTDGTPTITLAEPNVTTVFPSLAASLADASVATSVRAYNLSWIIHVIGDLHQPMHGTSRSSAANPTGDAGGNGVWVVLRGYERDSINLHSVWDGWVGRPSRNVPLDDVANGIALDWPAGNGEPDDALTIPRAAALATTLRSWADESATLARYVAYDFPTRNGAVLPTLSDDYVERSTRIARQRLALAAYRLAAVIESQLGR
jgi:hypothetical protein